MNTTNERNEISLHGGLVILLVFGLVIWLSTSYGTNKSHEDYVSTMREVSQETNEAADYITEATWNYVTSEQYEEDQKAYEEFEEQFYKELGLN